MISERRRKVTLRKETPDSIHEQMEDSLTEGEDEEVQDVQHEHEHHHHDQDDDEFVHRRSNGFVHEFSIGSCDRSGNPKVRSEHNLESRLSALSLEKRSLLSVHENEFEMGRLYPPHKRQRMSSGCSAMDEEDDDDVKDESILIVRSDPRKKDEEIVIQRTKMEIGARRVRESGRSKRTV